MTREAHLLSPYRPPTSYPVSLNPDESASWLTGYFVLWHPAVLERLAGPPRVSSTYDHDQPGEGFVYVVPEGPHLYQPDDWADRVRNAGAIAIKTSADRALTLENFRQAARDAQWDPARIDLPEEWVLPFAGLGYGYLLVDSLYEAMDHERLLDQDGFWADVQSAIALVSDPNTRSEALTPLRAAAEKLRVARESLNSNPISLLDWVILDRSKLDRPWPESLLQNLPVTVLGAAELFEQMKSEAPERFAELRGRFLPNLPSTVELVCGAYREREDALFPVESQWWNLRTARSTVRSLFEIEPEVFGRKRSANHPQIPSWIQSEGYRKAVLVSFDGALTPARNAAVVTWPGPDGKSVDAFGREPATASDPATFFNLSYTLHQAMTQDSYPTVALAHKGEPASVGYRELLALADLAPVVGQFVHVGQYLAEHHYGEYLGSSGVDDFFADYLDERTTTLHRPDAVTGFARHARARRRLDSAFTLASLYRSLTPITAEDDTALTNLEAIEDAIERRGADIEGDNATLETRLEQAEAEQAQKLADRIQVRSPADQPGVMVFNPCAFTRRVALELEGMAGPVPIVEPVKASQFDRGVCRVVVEVPSMGFAWIPRGSASVAEVKSRVKSADGNLVRNEFFEAELDPVTGGLRSFRDQRTKINRLGMYLVYNPGSKSVATEIKVTSAGPALGEVTASGRIVSEHNEVLAEFRHRLRAWAGRPALEVLLEIEPVHAPTGYPWHAYYGARYGWRDDRAAIFRGVNGANVQSSYTRPESTDYLELRLGAERTFLFTGGLPFLQRHGTRMADVILIPEGEQGKRFELLLAMDREYPMQTAAGWIAPSPVVMTTKGPPPVGTSSWLAHVDLPSLILTALRPVPASDGMTRAVSARFLECAGYGGSADLRFARDPERANMIDGAGNVLSEIGLASGAIPLEFSAGESFRVRAEWA